MASEIFSAKERSVNPINARSRSIGSGRRGFRTLDFDKRGRANVSEGRFMEYLSQMARSDDYTSVRNDVVYYFNSGGSKLAEYHRKGRYGVVF